MSSLSRQTPADGPEALTATAPLAVLIVEEEVETIDQYVDWLRGKYDVTTVTRGEVIPPVDENADIVVVDQRRSVRFVEELRSHSVSDCQVAMITMAEPPALEDPLRSSIDQYLVAPVAESELQDTVARLIRREAYIRLLDAHATVAVDHGRSMANSDMDDSDCHEEYSRLTQRGRGLQPELRSIEQEFETADFMAVWQRF